MTQIKTIYLIHHTHHDVGYANDQPLIWELITRFIDEAIDLAESYLDDDAEGGFRWTVETTSMIREWLKYASPRDIERLQALEKAGRIELTAMSGHFTPTMNDTQFIESLQIVNRLRQDYAFDIRYAMTCDVNGVNWSVADLLLDSGIEAFSMAINNHYGGAPQPRPSAFLWETASGCRLPVFNGWPYGKGYREGIGQDNDLFERNWARLQAYLDEIEYPLPILLMQSMHPFGDDATAYDFMPFIKRWNDAGKSPRIQMATPRMWWEAMAPYLDDLPVLRGDWTDYWNFGAISTACETAMNRRSRTKLLAADSAYAALTQLASSEEGQWTSRSFDRYREEAWLKLNLWDEHTWGADLSVRRPDHEDIRTQFNHKANYAYTARSYSNLLLRDAVADLTQFIQRESPDDILVYNPLPWARNIQGTVPYFTLSPRGPTDDTTSTRHHQDRHNDSRRNLAKTENIGFALPPVEVPGFGYKVIKRDTLIDTKVIVSESSDRIVENHRFRLVFNTQVGGMQSIYDKALGYEWVDHQSGYTMNQYIHEEVADREHPNPRELLYVQDWKIEAAEIPPGWKKDWEAHRQLAEGVITHEIVENALGHTITQHLHAPGCETAVMQTIFLPRDADYIECRSSWRQPPDSHPQATYILFPFALPNFQVHLDIGGIAIQPDIDQLPGVARDYFTVQNWCAFSNQEHTMIVTMPENPLVQIGDFHFGHYQQSLHIERAMLLGWVTNNYWDTNFPAYQNGKIEAHYRLYPQKGTFDESHAHQLGMETAFAQPIIQHLGEPTVASPPLASSGTLLQLPSPPIFCNHIYATPQKDAVILHLRNCSDTQQISVIRSGQLKIVHAMQCDLYGNAIAPIDVNDGACGVTIPARRTQFIRLT